MKLGLIKSVTCGDITLEHTRCLDALGFPRDLFELIEVVNGVKMHRPMLPPIKMNRYTRRTSLATYANYSTNEMVEFIRSYQHRKD